MTAPTGAPCASPGARQQVSTAAARTHAARLVQHHGDPVPDPRGGLAHLFPTAQSLVDLDAEDLALPRTRRTTLPGIGPWTVETIAMRALGDPDAFSATDLGVRLAACRLGLPERSRDLIAAAHGWRPWRAYAVQHLWATGDHSVNVLPR